VRLLDPGLLEPGHLGPRAPDVLQEPAQVLMLAATTFCLWGV
jgi:hypothetical protein